MIYNFLEILARYQKKSNESYQASATYACEAISAIRTVAFLAREDDVANVYHQDILQQRKENMRQILKSGALYAASQVAVLFITALGEWFETFRISFPSFFPLYFPPNRKIC